MRRLLRDVAAGTRWATSPRWRTPRSWSRSATSRGPQMSERRGSDRRRGELRLERERGPRRDRSRGQWPHVVPVCHVLDGDRILIASAYDRKIADLRENASISYCVDVYSEDWDNGLAQVIMSGEAYLVESGPEWGRDRNLMYEKFSQYERVAPIEAGDDGVHRVQGRSRAQQRRLARSARAARRSRAPTPCASPGRPSSSRGAPRRRCAPRRCRLGANGLDPRRDALDRASGVMLPGDHEHGRARRHRRRSSGRSAGRSRVPRRDCHGARRHPTPAARAPRPSAPR